MTAAGSGLEPLSVALEGYGLKYDFLEKQPVHWLGVGLLMSRDFPCRYVVAEAISSMIRMTAS